MSPYALAASIAAAGAFCAHCVAGRRWLALQLGAAELRPTTLWGDADVARRVLAISWHLVSAVFAVSAAALLLAALGAVEGSAVPRFVALLHAGFLAVGLAYLTGRLETLVRPFPAFVVACLAAVAALPWLA